MNSRGENGRKPSSVFGKKEDASDDAYAHQTEYLKRSSKLLITSIRNFKIKADTINSRESDLRMKTKDSHEYSYGADIRKMEPKMKEAEQYPIMSPHTIKGKDNDENNNSNIKRKEHEEVYNSINSNKASSKNKILFSKAREKPNLKLNDFHV